MSRSHKKVPWAGDTKSKARKREASSKIRRFLKNLENILPHSAYKKVYESWEICDYGWIENWKEYWNFELRRYAEHPEWYKKPPNKKEEYRKWYKCYKMK